MKNLSGPLGIGTGSVLAGLLLAAPTVSTAQRLGAAPIAAIETPYQTEHAWALREIVADINEIGRYRTKRPEPPPFSGAIAPWHPELLAEYATTQLTVDRPVAISSQDPPDQFSTLLDLSPDAILKANTVVSASLKREMRNPRAHESAALVLGAFGLREAADGMSDVRWVLNRMTAHLAVAQALRAVQSTPGVDGQLAQATFLALAGRQKTAIAAIDALQPATPALTAWQRALRVRITEDWRILTSPSTASRLEKLEYFRARRHTLQRTRAGQELSNLREPIAVDFGRIVQNRSFGVEDGQEFVVKGLANELQELAYVYRQLHQKGLPESLPGEIVNARAGRLLAAGDPQVVPWGAWAEFSQRHIGMSIKNVDQHYRHMLGLPDRADEFKKSLDALLGHLTLYPVASTGRTKGKKGTEADLSQIARAIGVAVKAPELVTFNSWAFIEEGAKYEPVLRRMPEKLKWFATPTASVPYDAGLRAEALVPFLAMPELEALIDEAPHNLSLLSRVITRFYMLQPLMTKMRPLIAARVEFDSWSMDSAIRLARTPEDRVALRRKACALAVNECLELAAELIHVDEAAAVAEYEKAFRDPSLDQISMTHVSGWLVSYYERTGQLVKAMDLADRSARVGSGPGLFTLARLFERRLRVKDADELFTVLAARYPQSSKPDLAAFLYRQAIVGKKPEYLARWQAIEKELFPAGLQPMATTMPAEPAKGVFVDQDSYWSRRVRLQAGDIIVGIDGWKVETRDQYATVIAFEPSAATHKFTAWRGVLFTVDLFSNHGMVLKDHPLKGWIE